MQKTVFALTILTILISCGNSPNATMQKSTKTEQKEHVEVLYFHGKQRCIACNAMERLTKEVLDNDFAQQLNEGKVNFKVIDISTKEGERIADSYEVTWSSLFINRWKEGNETRNNMTEFGFSHAKQSPDLFKEGVKKKIDELLN